MDKPTSFKVPLKGGAGKGIGKKVMGLPLWAWIAICGTAIIVALYLRSKQPADTAADEYTDDAVDGTYYETPEAYTPQEDTDVATDGSTGTGTSSKTTTVHVTVGDDSGCGKRPMRPAGLGKHWTCSNGKWVKADNTDKQDAKQLSIIRGNKGKNDGSGDNKNPCGNKPSDPAGKGFHWKCNNGKWVKAKNNAAQNAAQQEKIDAAKSKGATNTRQGPLPVSIGGNTASPVPARTAKEAANLPAVVQSPKLNPTTTAPQFKAPVKTVAAKPVKAQPVAKRQTTIISNPVKKKTTKKK